MACPQNDSETNRLVLNLKCDLGRTEETKDFEFQCEMKPFALWENADEDEVVNSKMHGKYGASRSVSLVWCIHFGNFAKRIQAAKFETLAKHVKQCPSFVGRNSLQSDMGTYKYVCLSHSYHFIKETLSRHLMAFLLWEMLSDGFFLKVRNYL